MHYNVKSLVLAPAWNLQWNEWSATDTADITNVRPEGSDHVPRAQARLFHDYRTIYGMFRTEDRYVRSAHVGYQVATCFDSCVEFFFKPTAGPGYFNLEINAGGSFLIYYVRDCTPARVGDGFMDYDVLALKDGGKITVKTTLPKLIEPEIETPVTWCAQFAVPLAALEPYCGPIGCLNGQQWTGNFYKCGDETSHPHWLSWAPVSELNFHEPAAFKPLYFL